MRGYAEDLPLWRSLADEHGDPVLDVGAGTGRVALTWPRRGHRVTALDIDPELIAELERRATGLDVTAVVADAREFELGGGSRCASCRCRRSSCSAGRAGRASFLRCAIRHLPCGGVLAIAIAAELDLFEVVDGGPAPLPDIREIDGVVYSSQPTAVRADPRRVRARAPARADQRLRRPRRSTRTRSASTA